MNIMKVKNLIILNPIQMKEDLSELVELVDEVACKHLAKF
jgi:hypothetical protein